MTKKIRIGIVGLQPELSWAARAHLPALQSLSDIYEIVGVANTSQASANAAARACGIPIAFENIAAMAASPDIDVIAVTVRVPFHLELVRAAVTGGKHIYCEWPIGNGLTEAVEMADMVRKAGVLGVSGTQARVASEVLYLRQLIADGYVGKVLSSTITAWGRSWGAEHDDVQSRGYLLERKNGANMLTIPMGHTLAAVREVLGDFSEIATIVDNRRGVIRVPETGEMVPFDAPDQVVVCGRIGDGAPISMHYRGGMPRGKVGLVWEINGTEGDLRVTGLHGGSQQVKLSLEGGRGDDRTAMEPITLPESYTTGNWPDNVNPGNVARLYARMAHDLRNGTRTAPTFDDGVELHRVIDAIERASETGKWVRVNAPNRPLPTP
ncbi:Gfo/Idh/MocA family protein [Noviherbaspirillum sedimenti]|uniref:Gfo/Idh/MocA family oxidoreductase n=1 Tax=Noviherbaspirillum sedimenti TaxID=2320865 RepID=A0A3A3G467_9BURK|nr:Gfo/Idh/MocA family oxidoreductase [Noviherbaspirillum sedimenti]RJG03268.1 gfo/Idh/MocA family oxidoreductase [Noviherbaspirillum sedimenti]